MRTRSAIAILTAASLLTGCGSTNSEVKDSSAADITVTVDETELGTTTNITLVTTASTSTHLVKTTRMTTTTTPQTTTELVTMAMTEPESTTTEPEPTHEEVQPEAPTDVQVVEGNVCPVTGITLQYTKAYCIYERPLNVQDGVMWYGGHEERYYSENVLPGPGLAIPGRHHGDDGTIRDAEGYICVAADYSFLPYGSIVVTSLGPAKVYDTGCAWGTIDIYTCW